MLGTIEFVDLLATSNLRGWGWRQEVALRKPSPCERDHCGGSILSFSGSDVHCLLCARPADDDGPILKRKRQNALTRRDRGI